MTKFERGDRIRSKATGNEGSIVSVGSTDYYVIWDNYPNFDTLTYPIIFGDDRWELTRMELLPIGNQSCEHIWTDYNGFRESYQYCKVCGIKKGG
jgi:hypothetical protein